MYDFKDRVVVVTGAAQGIGREVALGFAESGADVACIDLLPDKTESIAEEIRSLGRRALALPTDVTVEDQMQQSVNAIVNKLGAPDAAFNAAGISGGGTSSEDFDIDSFRRNVDVNLTGIMISCKHIGAAMLERGAGSICNVASMSGVIVNRGLVQPDYNSAKAGVAHLTKCLAVEWAERGVRVNSLSPGYVETPLTVTHSSWPELKEQFLSEVPMRRIAKPQDMVGPALFIASEASGYMTGHDLVVDGGFTCW